jgi:hypothetical protein
MSRSARTSSSGFELASRLVTARDYPPDQGVEVGTIRLRVHLGRRAAVDTIGTLD